MQNPQSQNPQSTTGKSGSDFGAAKDDLKSAKDNLSAGMKDEARSAQQTLNSAKEEVRRKAGEYASEAKSAAFKQAEGAQHDVGDKLAALGGALRAAGDRLANENQNAMSRLASEAAGTLDQFSQTLKTKGFGEVVEDVRQAARQHPGMVFAGAMLAGVALGRLFKSTPASNDGASGDYGGTASRDYGSGPGRYGSGSGRNDPFKTSPTAGDTSFPSTPAAPGWDKPASGSGKSAGLSGSTKESKL
jgi:hypothetical protein